MTILKRIQRFFGNQEDSQPNWLTMVPQKISPPKFVLNPQQTNSLKEFRMVNEMFHPKNGKKVANDAFYFFIFSAISFDVTTAKSQCNSQYM